MIKNKRGQMEIIWLFVIFIGILIIGFLAAIGIAFAHWTSSTIAPLTENLGMIDNVNVSQAGQTTFGTLDTIIGLLPMMVGFAYLMLLIGCIVLVMMYRGTANILFMGMYFAFALLFMILAILTSNAYQDLYTGSNEIALQLQSMTMLSYLILYSPYIFGIVIFVCGIFLFSGKQNESYGQGGQY